MDDRGYHRQSTLRHFWSTQDTVLVDCVLCGLQSNSGFLILNVVFLELANFLQVLP